MKERKNHTPNHLNKKNGLKILNDVNDVDVRKLYRINIFFKLMNEIKWHNKPK
jgi:hypothetical protein